MLLFLIEKETSSVLSRSERKELFPFLKQRRFIT